MKVQAAKDIIETLQKELGAMSASARKSSASAEAFLDESQFIAFELVRVTAELDAVRALLAEDLSSKKDTASPELVIAINEIAAELIALQSKLGANSSTGGKSQPVGSADYRAAVEAIAADRHLS